MTVSSHTGQLYTPSSECTSCIHSEGSLTTQEVVPPQSADFPCNRTAAQAARTFQVLTEDSKSSPQTLSISVSLH